MLNLLLLSQYLLRILDDYNTLDFFPPPKPYKQQDAKDRISEVFLHCFCFRPG